MLTIHQIIKNRLQTSCQSEPTAYNPVALMFLIESMMWTYLALFASAFLSASMLPGASEAVLLAALTQGHPAIWVFLVAWVGNVLGSCINYVLGVYFLRFKDRKWFFFTPEQLERMQKVYNRYGKWSVLLSWVPLVGDPLTCVAGFMRLNFGLFLLLVGISKSVRYLAVIAAFSWTCNSGLGQEWCAAARQWLESL